MIRLGVCRELCIGTNTLAFAPDHASLEAAAMQVNGTRHIHIAESGPRTWQPLWTTLSNASVSCVILLHCSFFKEQMQSLW